MGNQFTKEYNGNSNESYKKIKFIILWIIAVVVIVLVVGGYLLLNPSGLPINKGQIGKCGDGICQQVEIDNKVCLQDCEENPITKTRDFEDSPFAIHEVRFYHQEEIKAIKDLGAKSARIAPYGSLIWDMIETKRVLLT